MTRVVVALDFVRPPRKMNWRGVVLLAAGAVTCTLVLSDYREALNRRDGLEVQLEGVRATHRSVKPDKAAERVN